MTALDARALWLHPPHYSVIETETLPARGDGEVCVRTRFSAVSRGTETLVYAGRVPASEYERMRAPFQAGSLPGAVKHGYANVGIVEDGPADWRGRYVFCLYPHQTRYVVACDAVVPLPEDVPPERAILAASMETAVNAVWDAAPALGDRVTVVGAGVVGALIAGLCARIPGVHVELVDIDPAKRFLGDALGVTFRTPDRATAQRDLVVHSSASEDGLATALRLAGFEATILEMSWYGTSAVRVPLGEAFHSQRLTLRASQVGAVSPHRRARRDHRQRLVLAVSLLAEPRFDALIDAENAFDELPAVMQRLAQSDDSTLGQRIRYD